MNILLLNPPTNDQNWYRAEHLGLAFLASVLRKEGYDVQILDSNLENLDVRQTFHTILNRAPRLDVLGITAIEPQTLLCGVEVIRLLRQEGIHPYVVAGGYLPTFWYAEVLKKYPEIDSIVIGEGEASLKDLVEAIEHNQDPHSIYGLALRNKDGEVICTPKRNLIRDLDQIPFPARDYLSVAYQKYHHALVYSSRGCYHKCSFCQISQFYRLSNGSPYRSRSAANIADEIEILVNQYGARTIFFVDDEFITKSPKRQNIIRELISEIRKRDLKFSFSIQYRADTGDCEELLSDLKKVGLTTVFIGVESGIDAVLERFEKGINKIDIQNALRIVKQLGLNKNIGYMLFNPNTTFDELKESVEYLLSPDAPTILKLIGMMVLKGTPEEKKLREQNLVMERDFKIKCSILDKKVAAFADILKLYHPIYELAAMDFYEFHFLIGDLPEDDRERMLRKIKTVELKIRNLHQIFLSKAIGLSQNEKDDLKWLDDFKVKFQALYAETQTILKNGHQKLMSLSNKADKT